MISALLPHHGPHCCFPNATRLCSLQLSLVSPARKKTPPDYASIILGPLSVLVEFQAPLYGRMDPWVLFFGGLVRPERVGMG